MAPLVWSILDRILLACVLIGLVVMGGQLNQMQSRNLEMARQIETLGRQAAKAETRDTATEDRDKAMERQISKLVQQYTGQLDKFEAVLTDCSKPAAFVRPHR
jgi:hypothetical protein